MTRNLFAGDFFCQYPGSVAAAPYMQYAYFSKAWLARIAFTVAHFQAQNGIYQSGHEHRVWPHLTIRSELDKEKKGERLLASWLDFH